MKKIISLLLCLALVVEALSQRLHVGDRVPDLVFNEIVNYTSDKGKLSDFGEKYVILDFWNVYCSSCIASFPSLEKLQDSFSGKLQVLLVTRDSKELVDKCVEKSSIVKNIKLPIIVSDSIISQFYFPHNSVPFQVWIDKDRIVKATTTSASINNVHKFISGEQLSMKFREDRVDDVSKELLKSSNSLFEIDNGKFASLIRYYAALPTTNKSDFKAKLDLNDIRSCFNEKRRQIAIDEYYSLISEALPNINNVPFSGIELRKKNNTKSGIRFLNKPLYALYSLAFNSGEELKIIIEPNVNVLGPSDLKDLEKEDGNRFAVNQYCYEVMMPNYSLEKALSRLRVDLKNYFGVQGEIEVRPTNCMVLYRDSKTDLLKSDNLDLSPIFENTKSNDGIVIRNMPFRSFITYLSKENRSQDAPLVIDETSISLDERISMKLKIDNLYHSPQLSQELLRYGIKVRYETRNVRVLVLSNIE